MRKWIVAFLVVSVLAVCAYAWMKNTFSEPYSTKNSDDLGAALSSSDKTVAYFYSPSCSWCTKMHPVYDNVSSDYKKGVKFVKIDASQNKDLVNQHKIDGYPHILFFNGSKVVGSSSGYVDESKLKAKLDENFGTK